MQRKAASSRRGRNMRVECLTAEGFRNLHAGEIKPSPGVNILYGDNAQGKTNVLEALWLFTGGRSFRGAKDRELIAFGAERAACRMDFFAQERSQQAEIVVESRRRALLNGIPQTTPAKLAGVFCAVVFSPAHLSLIKDGPEERRRFLDAAYCQLRPSYIQTLAEYSRALTQRNSLLRQLREGGGDPALLDIWDQRLAASGARIRAARAAFIARLDRETRRIYDGLSAGREQMTLSYLTQTQEASGADTRERMQALLRELASRREADRGAGFTTAGPHRDDLEVRIDGRPARVFGSQGQQRSAVLALKLAEAVVLQEVTGEQPVALLDDVMSELDVSRQDYILNHIHDWQVFITCCDPSAVLRLTGGRVFHIRGGAVIREDGE